MPCGITANLSDTDKKSLYDSCDELQKGLKAEGVRCKVDLRENYSPGWKFNHWELKVLLFYFKFQYINDNNICFDVLVILMV